MALDYGIKISYPTKDISSSDPKDFALWSKYPVMKTYIVGTYTYTFPSDLNSVDITIDHNLAYYPGVWFSIDGSTQNSEWQTWDWWAYWYNSGGNQALRNWTILVTTGQISLSYRETNVSGSGVNTNGEVWSFKYYIFIDQIK